MALRDIHCLVSAAHAAVAAAAADDDADYDDDDYGEDWGDGCMSDAYNAQYCSPINYNVDRPTIR